jgi:hypothetical protein
MNILIFRLEFNTILRKKLDI